LWRQGRMACGTSRNVTCRKTCVTYDEKQGLWVRYVGIAESSGSPIRRNIAVIARAVVCTKLAAARSVDANLSFSGFVECHRADVAAAVTTAQTRNASSLSTRLIDDRSAGASTTTRLNRTAPR
jgi:hypothetical protein